MDATGTPALGPAERLKAENDARTTLLQGVAGLVLVVGAGATWRQLQINREGQITERFNKAIDHLGESGDDKIDVRLGGIYALERIANNSKDDRATIAEILAAYVRGHAAWTTPVEDADPSDASADRLRVRAPDIQAAMTVLGRRAPPPGKPQPLRLPDTDLRGADLDGANLERAELDGTHLEGGYLGGARLEGANLYRAHLEGAYLRGAHLEGASLGSAHLEGADLYRAHLEGAHLGGAHLERADLASAHLDRADLGYADLKRARLDRAHLKGAELAGAHLEEAELGGANLEGAKADATTVWPNDFNWRDANVQMR